jgi:hypothetical protein
MMSLNNLSRRSFAGEDGEGGSTLNLLCFLLHPTARESLRGYFLGEHVPIQILIDLRLVTY